MPTGLTDEQMTILKRPRRYGRSVAHCSCARFSIVSPIRRIRPISNCRRRSILCLQN